jgi:hypothetical protein
MVENDDRNAWRLAGVSKVVAISKARRVRIVVV